MTYTIPISILWDICNAMGHLNTKGEIMHFQGKHVSKLFLFPSDMGSALKRKNLLLCGANSFISEQTSEILS